MQCMSLKTKKGSFYPPCMHDHNLPTGNIKYVDLYIGLTFLFSQNNEVEGVGFGVTFYT